MKPAVNNELDYFIVLKRIARYMDTEELHRRGEKLYGVSGPEAVEMAYENVLAEARGAIKGKRAPKVKQ
jgi:hypothetical protein